MHFLPILVAALQADGVRCAKGEEEANRKSCLIALQQDYTTLQISLNADITTFLADHPGRVSFRIGGLDRRKEQFRGTIELEPFRRTDKGLDGSFVVMTRERGNPLTWRQLWKQTVLSEGVKEHVLMKGSN